MLLHKRLLLLLPVVVLMSSCSEDFKVAAPYKPVTVIYGMLNAGDTAQYIRIQKAFLDESKSALDMAQVADSNFYSSLSVHLKEFSNGVLLADDSLVRVDLNKEGFRKDTGAFFNAPNYAYKSKRKLVPTYTYQLVVTNTATGEVDSATTAIIDNLSTSPPPQGFIVTQFNRTYTMSFPALREDDDFSLNISAPNNSQIYDGIIRFHYVTKNGGVQTNDSVDWLFATAERDEDERSVKLTVNERSFYNFLSSNIPPAPTGAQRYMDSVDVFVWAGGKDLATYQRVNGAQGGLTSDQIKPLYTNMRGRNVLGLFSTRARTQYYGIGINDVTLDSLMKSPVTKALNIQGRSDH